MDLCVRRNGWVDVRWLYKVDDQECWLEEEIPAVSRKTRVRTSVSGDEVRFECLDCTFHKVGAVITGGSNLDVKVFTMEGFNEFSRDFVVKTDEARSKTLTLDLFFVVAEGADAFLTLARADGFGCNIIGIIL